MAEEKADSKKEVHGQNIEVAIVLIHLAGEQWSSTFVPRSQVPTFTGGLYTVGTMANADCLGKGPEGGFRLGKQWCYPVTGLVSWLVSKLEKGSAKNG